MTPTTTREQAEITLDIPGLRLAGLATSADGTGDAARRLLALHGWLDNAASFTPLARAMPEHAWVALDLPGHGHSQHKAPDATYHFVDYVIEARAAADALGWDRFTLVGHSLGGAVASLLAAAQPDRVERLVLIEALGPLSEPAEEAPARLRRAIHHRLDRWPGEPPVYADLAQAIDARRRAGGLGHEASSLLAERGTRQDPQGLRWRTDPRLRHPSPYRLTEDQVLAFLRAIEVPTLVLAAGDGLLRPGDPWVARRLDALPHARVAEVDGNHHVHLERPEAVAAILRPFLAGV